jgi:hypothetical protein
MPKGLLNPKNAVKSTGGGFKEGNVRVDDSYFAVPKPQDPQPGMPDRLITTSLVWDVTRLDEELEPLTHPEDDTPVTERLLFSCGGKSLAQVHPGKAESPDDNEIEDAGAEPGESRGNTLFLVNTSWMPHEKSSVSQLYGSLKDAGYKEEYLDRIWAPDFKGLVCRMKTKVTDERIRPDDKNTINYKVVDRIIRAPYEKPKSKTTGKAPVGAAANGQDKGAEAEGLLAMILVTLQEANPGVSMTRKALNTRINQQLQERKIDPRLFVPVMSFTKDDAWLRKHAADYGMTVDFDKGTVVFGDEG